MNSDVDRALEEFGTARATLDAWRARGADRMDPLRFHFMEALERRTAGHSGAVRRILDERLSGLLAAYAEALEKAAVAMGQAADTAAAGAAPDSGRPAPLNPRGPARGALGELLDQIAGRVPSAETGRAAADHAAPSRPAPWPELAVLEYFREVWSRLGTEKQLQQSQQQVPGNAGPLNSSSLVHRSLSLMQELSPGYLQQFLSYVDALSWLEQMGAAGAPPGKETARAAGTKKGTRGTSR